MAQGQATKVKKKKKSVLKRAAQSIQRAEVNRANRTRVRTMMRKLRTAITAGDATAAGNLLQPTMSAIDQRAAREHRQPLQIAPHAGLQRHQGKGREVARVSRFSILRVGIFPSFDFVG